MSIFFKIFISILLSSSIFFTIFVNYVVSTERNISIEKLNKKIKYNKKTYFNSISQILYDFNEPLLNIIINSMSNDAEISSIQLIDYSKVINILVEKRDFKKVDELRSIIELKVNNEALGKLVIFYNYSEIDEHIKNYTIDIITFAILFFLIMLFIIMYFVNNTIKNIKALSNVAIEITSGNLNLPIKIKTNDEIGILSNKFEEMRLSLKNTIIQIKQQLDFHQTLIDTIDVPIYVKNKDLKFTSCNQSFLEFYNLNKDQILGKSIDEIINKQIDNTSNFADESIFLTLKKEVFQNQKNNYKNETKDIITYKNVYLDANNNPAGIVAADIDITEVTQAKKKIEKFNEQLQEKVFERTEKLEDSNIELQATIRNLKQMQEQLIDTEKMASLGGLVAGVAHEINTPIGIGLTGITHLEGLSKEIDKKYKNDLMTQEEFEEYLLTSNKLSLLILKNLEKASSLVRSFKQVAVDQTSEEKRSFNLYKYTKEILESMHSITKKREIEIEISCIEDININSYPGAYSQIISNLIMNSYKHAFDENSKGKINISFKKVDKSIELIYEDNGKGIKKENIKKIFEPFFTTKRDFGGSGLGLNIIYNIISSKFSGSIVCTSELNKGTKFLIILNCS